MSSSSGSLIVTGVPARLLWDCWPGIWPLIEKAYRKSEEKADILGGILSKDLQAWAIYEKNIPIAGIVSRLLREGTSGELHCHVWLIGGSRLSEWAPDFVAKLIAWAKSEGCSAVTGNGRRGWSRIMPKLGFHRIDDRDGLPCWKRAI